MSCHVMSCLTSPHLIYGEGVLQSSTEASIGTNARPRLKPTRTSWSFQQTSEVCSNVPLLICLELRTIFQTVFFVSQREHYILLEGVDWCHILPHKEGTLGPLLSSEKSNADCVQ